MANNSTLIMTRDEEKLARYNMERNARRMTKIELLGKVCELQGKMENNQYAYNTIARKSEITEEDEKKMSSLEATFDTLNEEMVLYAKAAHYRTILDDVKKEDKDGNVTYIDGIVKAVTKPYYSFKRINVSMDSKAGVKLAKISDKGKGLVSLTELQSFAGQSIGASPEWSVRAGELQKLLTARIATDLEVGKEIGITSFTADTINLYREVRVDSTKNNKVSNTKLTEALKEAVKAALPKNKCKSAAHIADVRYLIAAMTSSTKKLGEVRAATGDKFNDLLISVFARVVGVTEGYTILA